ncbi:YihY/virulence factor BrkB family protein [Aurantimicrobium sp. MWH-Uga1]|uniref:YihY/virulence factor BrkB family protein n=1 Tax=Aurantimicrobium sp. MWH-Uga1 TaxID=2079575 RepID=UPI000DEE18E7|nr:YihY/virulence factor BrkB family protein [Aurantimicrobium sp. MWH-Uga1]AXE54992.1 Inner membrane protein YhjD [Aurantimicrobium sp. MWH-Uga1]
MKKALVWAQQRRPYRVYKIYSAAGGNLLAAGMSFQALFATFAAVWVGFSLSGIYLHERPELKNAIIDFINTQIPDLIRSGGPIDPHVLDSATSLGWTGGIAVLVVLYTAINWLNYVRTAVRTIFALPPSRLNFVLLKLYDLVLALGYGIFVVLTAALTVVVTNLANLIFPAIGIIDENGWGKIAFQIGGLVIVYFFDVVMLALMMNVLSGVPIPLRNLRDGVLLGALALTLLKVAGSFILTRTDSNPLLASFTVFIGLLIYFNFASRIYLFATSWVALSMQDEQVEVRDLGWIVPHRHSSD